MLEICIISKIWKQPKYPSTDEKILCISVSVYMYIYIHSGVLTIKKYEIIPFTATWRDLEIIILSGVSLKKKDKYHLISLKCEI